MNKGEEILVTTKVTRSWSDSLPNDNHGCQSLSISLPAHLLALVPASSQSVMPRHDTTQAGLISVITTSLLAISSSTMSIFPLFIWYLVSHLPRSTLIVNRFKSNDLFPSCYIFLYTLVVLLSVGTLIYYTKNISQKVFYFCRIFVLPSAEELYESVEKIFLFWNTGNVRLWNWKLFVGKRRRKY